MAFKFKFYETYGVEEYYIYDPDDNEFIGYLRSGQHLEIIEEINGWVSPRLNIRFQLQDDTLEIYRPDGQKFLSFVEIGQLREQERQEKENALSELEQQRRRNELLEAKLRELGIDTQQL